MTSITRIFVARKILTMNPSRPVASHVAVRDGRILGVGSLKELTGWGRHELDERFADRVLMPGLVEGHSHLQEGLLWEHPYVGFYDRRSPDGKLWKGLKSVEEVVARLREADRRSADPDEILVAWGFDPIFFGTRPIVAADLDSVSVIRPIIIIHASLHLLNVNSVVLQRAGITSGVKIDGIGRGADGEPNGEIRSIAAAYLVYKAVGGNVMVPSSSAAAVRRFGQSALMAGTTTVTDLYSDLPEETVAAYRAITAEPDFPVRVVPALNGHGRRDGVDLLRSLAVNNTDKLRFGLVKLIVDGSIQGFTARLRWPGYYNGSPNGLWYIAPGELKDVLLPYHKAGFHTHIHTNGDEASEVALDAIEAVLAESPRLDHRCTLQHCQMADAALFRRMAILGVCANLFANHIYYWGDAHYTQTMGPERAERMDAAATAIREGVRFAIHSDAPITPLAPLFTAWCAVNRLTASGRRLGEGERIPVEAALRAITLGAAYTLRLDSEIGSIEAGKLADFAVLDDDPIAIAPERLKDIRVWGTVLGGQVFQAPASSS